MKDSTDDFHRPRRSLSPTARWASAVVTLVAVALLPAACGSPSAGSSTSSGSRGGHLLAFSRCMRSHGVPNFPDPSNGRNSFDVDAQQLGVSDSQYQAAVSACRHLLPTGGSLQQQTGQCLMFGDCPPALLQRLLTVERRYAQCMRSHGMPDWPDPTVDGGKGRPVFDLSDAGIDPQITNSSQFRSEDRECRLLIGGSVPTLPST